jgi:hypothetical protein
VSSDGGKVLEVLSVEGMGLRFSQEMDSKEDGECKEERKG